MYASLHSTLILHGHGCCLWFCNRYLQGSAIGHVLRPLLWSQKRLSQGAALHAGNSYPALDGSTNRPGFCYDTALLLPEFNPMAVPMPAADSAGSSGLVASPLTTVLVFSQASGTDRALGFLTMRLLRFHPWLTCSILSMCFFWEPRLHTMSGSYLNVIPGAFIP